MLEEKVAIYIYSLDHMPDNWADEPNQGWYTLCAKELLNIIFEAKLGGKGC